MSELFEDDFLKVGKLVYDCLPFTNKGFKPGSVNDAAKMLKVLNKKGHISDGWMRSAIKASDEDRPVYIDCGSDWTWKLMWGEPKEPDDRFYERLMKIIGEL